MPRNHKNARKNYANRPCFTEMANALGLTRHERHKLMKEYNKMLKGGEIRNINES